MNDELATQATTTPLVLKIKTLDDHHPNVILPHTSHLSAENLDDTHAVSSSLLRNDETSTNISNHASPTSLRVKLKTSFLNGTTDNTEDEFSNPSLTDLLSRPAKRCKNSLSNEFDTQTTSVINAINDPMISSQEDTEKLINEIVQDYEPSIDSPPLVIRIRRDSSTTNNPQMNPTSEISFNGESESNRQLLIKIKKNEHGDIVNTQTTEMSTEYLLTEQNCANNNDLLLNKTDLLHSNGYHEQIYESTSKEISTDSPPINKMLVNVDEKISISTIPTMNNYMNQEPQASTTSSSSQIVEGHTKELLDEALDSVKNVLMQTIKKNLESGGDLNSLKTTLGSDEVAEVFLAKLRQSLKRETTSIVENIESKPSETALESETANRCETPNPTMSPITNVVSSPSSSSPLLPPLSTMISKTTSPSPSSSTTLPSSPQPQTPSNSNSKRKAATPSTNPNRFEGASEEELAKRLLTDILQPNLDIVFVGINPSLYAVHKGHHYGGPGNHFWKLLHMCGLIPTPFTATDDHKMPQFGIGFTNIVQRPAKAGSDITKDEITAGAEILLQKIKMFRPKIIVFNGRGIYEVYAGNKHFHYGKQPEPFPGSDAHVFVMPSSSARCSQLPRAEDKLPFFVGLKKLRDFVTGSLPSLNESEITFPDIKIKDTDDVLQKTTIRINNKPFSELSPDLLKTFGDKYPSSQLSSKNTATPTTQTMCSSPSPSSSSSPSLVFNTEALTTQTMSILHNSFLEQNDNLITHDQQPQRVYLQNDGQYSTSPPSSQFSNNPSTAITIQPQRLSTSGIGSMKSSFLENNSSSSTNAAVLAALAGSNTNSTPNFYQPTQTVFLGGVNGQQSQQQSQQISFSTSSMNNGTTILTVRPSGISTANTTGTMIHNSNFNKAIGSSTSSHVIHHYANSVSSNDSSNHSIHLSSSPASTQSRPVVVVNSSESLPSFESILHPSISNSSTYSSQMRTSTAVIVPSAMSNSTPSLSSLLASSSPMPAAATNSTKDFISSQLSANKSTLILVPPTIKQINSNASNIILPKLTNASKVTNSFSAEKRTNDDCLFIRYERESATSNSEQYRFSFVIDEYPTSTQKRSRYVSINDL